MSQKIEGHSLSLAYINPKVKINSKNLMSFFEKSSYTREQTHSKTDRYPKGASSSGTISIEKYPHQNEIYLLVEDKKEHTQSNKHSYQTPREVNISIFLDNKGYGHVFIKSNTGIFVQGVITKLTKSNLSFLVYGDAEHTGDKAWIKSSITKNKNGSYKIIREYKKDLASKWKEHSKVTLLPS